MSAWHKTERGRKWMRGYRREWMRSRRRDPVYYAKELAAAREKKRKPLPPELLALIFPGCWKDPEWMRIYKRVAQRERRKDSKLRAAENRRQSERRRENPAVRETYHAGVRRWKAAHPERVREEWAKYSAENRARLRAAARRYYANRGKKCFFCGKAAKSGPTNGMKKIPRMVPDGRGRFVEREVLWCGKC